MKRRSSRIRSIVFSLLMFVTASLPLALSGFVLGVTSESYSIQAGPAAVCHIGSTKYTSIGKAIESSKSGDTIYVYPGNTSWENENYTIVPTNPESKILTIPSGVTLSIPYAKNASSSTGYTVNTYKASLYNQSHGIGRANATPKSVVTLGAGVTLVNNGTIEIGGELSAGSGNNNSGYTTTNYSAFIMGDNSVIQNVGKIYAYGYIGETTVGNSSQIICRNSYTYEDETTITGMSETHFPFLWYDFAGGSSLKAIYDSIGTALCLPFDDFYFENITPTITFYGGSKAFSWVNLYAASYFGSYVLNVIGTTSDCIITLTDTNSYLVSDYDQSSLVSTLDFYGGCAFNELKIDVKQAISDSAGSGAWLVASLAGVPSNVSSSEGFFPLTYHFNISLNPLPDSGTNAIFNGSNNRYKLMDGGNVKVAKGASLKTKAFVVYDAWDHFTGRGTHANAPKSLLYVRKDLCGTAAKVTVNGSLSGEYLAGTFTAETEGATLETTTGNTFHMYEPKAGSGEKTSATMTEWFERDFTLTLKDSTGAETAIGTVGKYISVNGSTFYYWTENVSKKIDGISISASSTATDAGKAATITMTSSLSPSGYDAPESLSYEWSVTGDSGATIAANADPSSATLSVPANESTESDKYAYVTCTIRVTYSGKDEYTRSSTSITVTAKKTESSSGSCFSGDTLIQTDHGEVRFVDLGIDDKVLTYNLYDGEFEYSRILTLINHGPTNGVKQTLHFSNGRSIEFINGHELFDMELQKYVFLDENNLESYLGHEFAWNNDGQFGSTELVSFTAAPTVECAYSIITENNLNVVAESLVTLTPIMNALTNYFNIVDGRIDRASMEADILTYGLYEYSEWSDVMTEVMFDAFNVPYLKVAVGKGIVSRSGICALVDYCNALVDLGQVIPMEGLLFG